MKSSRSNKKWLLASVGLLFALLILKITFLLTAKPKITVDYVAEYNRITLPQNYDPNDNAAEYYQKAFDSLVEMPNELRNPYINWPTDFNSTEQAILKDWLASNSQTLKYFKIASNKPFYWLERYTDENNNMLSIMLPNLNLLKRLSEALLWNAKLAASKGQPQTACENIIDCYKAGCQKCRTPSFLVDQLVGMSRKRAAIDTALLILDKTHIDSSALKLFQDALQAEFDKDTYVLDFEAEKMMLYDILQITFVDNGRGTGRLSCSVIKYFQTMCGSKENFRLMCKLFLKCLIGPTRNDMVIRIEETFASFELLKTETPWQLHTHDPIYFKRLDTSNCDDCGDFILDIFLPAPFQPFNSYHQVRTNGKALLAIIAIHRFKAEKGILPATLDELVSTGYLQSVPMDPYSDGPLVYKPDKDNFKLYSLGEDFIDDGGSNESKATEESRLRYGGPYGYSVDIVYWPYKDLKKLYNAHIIELKKIREKTERNLLILYRENTEPNEIRQLKEEWWKDIELEFTKYPKEYPDINKIRCFKEDWWGIIEKDAKHSLENADQNRP